MFFSRNERTALFIDGPNLFASMRQLGFEIDYRRLLSLFRGQTHFIRGYYYTAIADDQEFSSIRPLIDWLGYNGYCVVTKPVKEFLDSAGRRKLKANMDTELAVDAMRLSAHVDHLIIFSGNGEFRYLVAALQEQGRRVTVVSTLQTQPQMISDDLRRQADQFIELADLESEIGRPQSDQGQQRRVSHHAALPSSIGAINPAYTELNRDRPSKDDK